MVRFAQSLFSMNYFVNPSGKISPAANICRKFAANLPQPFYHANKGCGKLAANVIMQIRFAASLRQLFVANLRQTCRNYTYTNFMCVNTFNLSLSNYTAPFLKSQFLSLYELSLEEFLKTHEI